MTDFEKKPSMNDSAPLYDIEKMADTLMDLIDRVTILELRLQKGKTNPQG
jgi:hypothetical protein